ncbi:MAG: CAP domain-containing protein, partial [Acidimicrobiales bacterium]
QAVHDAWMGSNGHRRNIVDCRFTAIGVGVNTSAWTWTEDFGY